MIDPISAINSRALGGLDPADGRRSRSAAKADPSKQAGEPGNLAKQLLSTSVERTETSVELSIRSGPDELRFSVEAVMERVSTVLREKFALPEDEMPDAPAGLTGEVSAQELLDFFSPAKTAERILGFSTAFMPAYLGNHEGEDGADQVNGFTNLIGGAMEEGFRQAEQALGGNFDDLGDIGKTIQRTFELVMEGLSEFREKHLRLLGESADLETDTALPEPDISLESTPEDSQGGDPQGGFDLTA